MRKGLLTALSVVSIGSLFPASAEEGKMIARTVDGRTMSVNLMEGMNSTVSLTEEGNSVKYMFKVLGPYDYETQTSEILFEVPVINMESIEFTGLASIRSVNAGESVSVDILGGKVSVAGVDLPVTVCVYSIDGKKEMETVFDHDMEFDLHRYGAGIHMVKVGSIIFKILVK